MKFAVVVFSVSFCFSISLMPTSQAAHWRFDQWIRQHFTPEQANNLIRPDKNPGSFGGDIYKKDVLPLIFIHGMNNEAGSLWKVRRDIVAGGYPEGNTFATTWGRGEELLNLNVKMTCNFIQTIRLHIEAVLNYTQADQVNIIGYSMGSPMARKAILGGKCVDNPSINLGPPLTKRVHTFISVAGANQGSQLCVLPFLGICNMETGLSCNSKFLRDINSKYNYEASYRSYNLASTGDMIVGYLTCGKKASHFVGAIERKINGKGHVQTEYDTGNIQLELIREGQNVIHTPASTTPNFISTTTTTSETSTTTTSETSTTTTSETSTTTTSETSTTTTSATPTTTRILMTMLSTTKTPTTTIKSESNNLFSGIWNFLTSPLF